MTVGRMTIPYASEAEMLINSIVLYVDSGKVLDEIRIGPTLNSVMVGTKPLR
jgi:hypothetical protein